MMSEDGWTSTEGENNNHLFSPSPEVMQHTRIVIIESYVTSVSLLLALAPVPANGPAGSDFFSRTTETILLSTLIDTAA
jgi:hypothetical protein